MAVEIVDEGHRVDEREAQPAGGGDVAVGQMGHALLRLEMVTHRHIDAAVIGDPVSQRHVLAETGARLGHRQIVGHLAFAHHAPAHGGENHQGPGQPQGQQQTGGKLVEQGFHGKDIFVPCLGLFTNRRGVVRHRLPCTMADGCGLQPLQRAGV